MIGTISAATTEPGSASSIRRMRGVSVTRPIIQKPAKRVKTVTAAIAAIA